MEDDEVNSLFVYGTLCNQSFFKQMFNIEPIDVKDGYIHAKMYHCGNFPMILEDSKDKVYGLLYYFDNLKSLLPAIDRYECCNEKEQKESLYVRKKTTVTLSTNEQISALTYFGNEFSEFCKRCCVEKNLIREGRWKD